MIYIKIIKYLNGFKTFFKGEERTVKAKKNILASILIKGIDAIVYLLLVPVTLGYLNSYEYGIWLTLNSILMWINSFDIGLGNGMRNKLAEAIALNDRALGRAYVSTTFIMLIILMGSFIVIGSILGTFINWYAILNTSPIQVPNLSEIVYISFVIFCLNFIFKFIGNVYLAMQLPAVNNLMVVLGHVLSLIIIYILTLTTTGSLLWVALVYSASPLFIYIIAYPITFKKIYPYLAPSFNYYNKKYLRNLFNVGVQFFILQLSGILLFTFSNLLISHMFGPEYVTPYNIAYRYFSLVPMVMNLVLAPMWSATTDAYAKGDIVWIKRTIKGIHKILFLATIALIIMVVIAKYIYRVWIGTEIQIPLILSALIALYSTIIIWSLSYSNFLNGLGKLRLQTINTVVVAIMFIPVCYILGLQWGILGIVSGMCILNTTGLILNRFQFIRIVENRAIGIWNK